MSRPRIPGAALEPLREALRGDPNIVRAWWGHDTLSVALEDVGAEIDEYKAYVEDLAARILSIVGPYGIAFSCGPTFGFRPDTGAVLVYDRGDA